LEEDFDEDTRRSGGFFFVEVDDGEHVPAERIGGEHVAKELGDITESIRLVPMDSVVIGMERLFEEIGP